MHPPVQTTNFSVPLKRRVNLIDNDFSKVQKNHEKNHHKSPIYAIFDKGLYAIKQAEFIAQGFTKPIDKSKLYNVPNFNLRLNH